MARARSYPISTHHYPHSRQPEHRRPLWRRPMAVAGLMLMAVVLLAVSVGPLLVRQDPNAADARQVLAAPSSAHLLGTDNLGRDVLSRLLHGGRASLAAGLVAVGCAVLLGVAFGIVAGYSSGAADIVIGATADILLAFPGLLLALLLAWLWGKGIDKAALAVGIAGAPVYMRVARASVRRVRRAPYVRAAEAIGARPLRVLLRHVLPNIAGPLLALVMLDLGWAVLHVSALSFLGVGVRPPAPEWGAMLSEARTYFRAAPWLGIAPGGAIALTVLAVNLLGEAWEEGTDPLRRRR
ncbi:MAG: ABC transporter permease [Anaerolineae bacterium]